MMHDRKAKVAMLSVVSNTCLVLLKLAAGLFIGSVSVISEAVHSGVDLLASVIAFFAVRASSRPADKTHHFGHEKWENISGTIEALLIFVAALWIIFEAARKLWNPAPLESASWGVGVMALSCVVNMAVSHQLFKVGNATQSQALLADGWHLRTDVWTSAGVLTGLALIWLGQWLLPGLNLRLLDSLAAFFVAGLIIKTSYELTLQAGRDLLDISLPEEEMTWIRGYLSQQQPEINGFHNLRTRRAGHRRFVEFHLELPEAMSVAESHGIADRIEEEIAAQYPGTEVTIHVEPSSS